MLVADTANNRVQVFDADGGHVGQFDSNGTGGGGMLLPAGVSSNGTHAFVADALNARVEIFSSADWSHAGRVDIYGGGDGGGRLGMPTGVDANSTHLFVSDSANYSVAVLGHGGQYDGEFATPLGAAAKEARLNMSRNILDAHLAWYGLNGSGLALSYRTATMPGGAIAIADFADRSIYTFAPDDTRSIVDPWGTTPNHVSNKDRLSDVDVDGLGRIVSSEWTRGLVRVIDANGTRVEEFRRPWVGRRRVSRPGRDRRRRDGPHIRGRRVQRPRADLRRGRGGAGGRRRAGPPAGRGRGG